MDRRHVTLCIHVYYLENMHTKTSLLLSKSKMAGNDSTSVVTLSFRKMCIKKRKYVADGEPVLVLEVIGELHTLTDIGEKLFDSYLGNILGECLNDHIWRFEVLVNEDDDMDDDITSASGMGGFGDSEMVELALDKNTPVLSKKMIAREPYEMGFCSPRRNPLGLGSAITFFYDEGTTTRLAVKVEKIEKKKPCDSLDLFPREKGQELGKRSLFSSKAAAATFADAMVEAQSQHQSGEGGASLATAAGASAGEGGFSVDSAFPHLKDVILSKRYSTFFGVCGKEMCGAVEGGPTDNGDQIYCPLAFNCMEDYLICTNHAWPTIATIMAEGKMREGWVSLLVLPPQPQITVEEEKMAANKKLLERLERLEKLNSHGMCVSTLDFGHGHDSGLKGADKPTQFEMYMMCGPRQVFCRMTVLELEAARAALREQGFDFAQRYPGIHACTTKEACTGVLNNVWFKSRQNGRMLVAVGMKGLNNDREAKITVQDCPRPSASLLDAFSTVEEALQAYLAGKKKEKKRARA